MHRKAKGEKVSFSPKYKSFEDLISFFSDLNEEQHIDLKAILSMIINSIFPDKTSKLMLCVLHTS